MSCVVYAIYPPGWLLPRASAKKVEMQAERVGTDAEKEGYDEDLNAPAEIPDSVQHWVLWPFVRYPWLGKVF
eukprot:689077-Pelagomonas_calceolata.AAC.1